MRDEPATPSGRAFAGHAVVTEAAPRAMVTLRGTLADPTLAAAVRDIAGVEVPGVRRIALNDGTGAGWMSPDELLLLLPAGTGAEAVARLGAALSGTHHLAADVSDARAAFRVTGAGAREALQKLSPTDLAPGRFGPGELRRTRLAQIAAAFWIEGTGAQTGFTVVCFRSVADYAFEVLRLAAAPGGEVGLWR